MCAHIFQSHMLICMFVEVSSIKVYSFNRNRRKEKHQNVYNQLYRYHGLPCTILADFVADTEAQKHGCTGTREQEQVTCHLPLVMAITPAPLFHLLLSPMPLPRPCSCLSLSLSLFTLMRHRFMFPLFCFAFAFDFRRFLAISPLCSGLCILYLYLYFNVSLLDRMLMHVRLSADRKRFK